MGSTTMLGTRCVRHECCYVDMVGPNACSTGRMAGSCIRQGSLPCPIGMLQGTQKISARGGDTMPVNFREGPCHGGYGVGPQKLPEGPGSSSSRKGAALKLRSPKDSSVHREQSLYHRRVRAEACQQLQRVVLGRASGPRTRSCETIARDGGCVAIRDLCRLGRDGNGWKASERRSIGEAKDVR